MTEHELEQGLRRALRAVEPSEGFCDRVMAQIEGPVASPAQNETNAPSVLPAPRIGRLARSQWAPITLAACVIAGIGLVHWRQQALERQRGLEASAQLLQALSIVSLNLTTVHEVIYGEEKPAR